MDFRDFFQRIQRIGIEKLDAVDGCLPSPGPGINGIQAIEQSEQVSLINLPLPASGNIFAEKKNHIRIETKRLFNRPNRVGRTGRNDVLVNPLNDPEFLGLTGHAQSRCGGRYQSLVALKKNHAELLLRGQSVQRTGKFLHHDR